MEWAATLLSHVSTLSRKDFNFLFLRHKIRPDQQIEKPWENPGFSGRSVTFLPGWINLHWPAKEASSRASPRLICNDEKGGGEGGGRGKVRENMRSKHLFSKLCLRHARTHTHTLTRARTATRPRICCHRGSRGREDLLEAHS